MKILKSIFYKLINLALIYGILFIVSPEVSITRFEDRLSVFFLALALFSETLLLIPFFRKYRINQDLLQFLWVFVTCFTFYFFFVNDYLWNSLHVSKRNNLIIAVFEIFVSLIEGLLLHTILKFKSVSKNESKKTGLIRCLLLSLIINAESTLFGYIVNPIFIKISLMYLF